MRKLYIGLDDTLLDTESYMRLLVELQGNRDMMFSDIAFVKSYVCDIIKKYDVLPFKEGAEECLPILDTEYDIILCSSYSSDIEYEIKKNFAEKIGKELILYRGGDCGISSINMKDDIFIDDNLDVVAGSNASCKIQMYNPYNFHLSRRNQVCSERDILVTDWFQVMDYLVEVNIDEDIRRRFCKGISKFCIRCGIQGHLQHTAPKRV